MRRHVSETERLIEEGLSRYGAGDVEGALQAWEQALDREPDNPQAASYVDYVKTNWDVLTGVPDGDDSAQDYGFSDEPEYQIEILPGQLRAGEAAPLHIDPADQGWYLHDEPMKSSDGDIDSPSDAAMTLELEADEPELELDDGEPEIELSATPMEDIDDAPPLDEGGDEIEQGEPEIEPPEEAVTNARPGSILGRDESDDPEVELEAEEPPEEVELEADAEDEDDGNLDDATSEYRPEMLRTQTQDFDSPTKEFDGRRHQLTPAFGPEKTPTPAFGPEATPVGFNTQPTDIRRRDLGFVKTAPSPADDPGTSRSSAGAARTQTKPAAPPPAPAPPPGHAGPPAIEPEESFADLIESLPSPRPPASTTRDMPQNTRPPAEGPRVPMPARTKTSASRPPAEVPRAASPSGPPQIRTPALPLGVADTIKPGAAPARPGEPVREKAPSRPPEAVALGTAPTRELPRELGGEPAGAPKPSAATTQKLPPMETYKSPPTQPPAPLLSNPTRDLGLRPAGAAPVARHAPTVEEEQDTPTDPLAARCAQILREIDAEAPPGETVDDRTRRRISSLLDRALAWNGLSDYEKAVTAAEMALEEDPNSAVAQKLVQRHRDTIMAVFQNYLGDLQRVPALAKPLHQLGGTSISPRAAFLLSRIDGTLSIDELMDVSGMPRLEAYRYLCQLFLRGILR